MLSPINIAGPDQRRKQLMQKLSQQTQQHGSVPMPPGQHGSAAALGAGVNFKSPGMRALPGVQNTNGSNVLASILARLGIGGRAQDNEMSSGLGSPISPYGPHYIPPPAASAGSPIPAGGGTPPPLPPPGQALPDPGFQGGGNPALQVGNPDYLGGGNPAQHGAPNPGFLGGGNPALGQGGGGPVPLGGGLYFDPNSGQIINLGGGGAGSAALLGGVGHATA